MINLKNLKPGKRGAHDIAKYLEHLRDEDRGVGYYQSDGAPSEWYGAGARDLGLERAVRTEDLARILEGKLPDGTDLSKRGNRQDDRRMGVDMTISAPKSVSIQGLAGGDGRVLEAHDRAVRKALDFIESEVTSARKGKGGTEREYTGSLVAATFRHEDSRPVDGHVDPQLHTHCIILNATRRRDGTWSAMDLDFGEHSVRLHLADAVYKSELALEVQKLGYKIRRTADGFELSHITDAQIDHFSKRRDQVDAELERRNTSREQASGAEKAAANLATRERKQQIDKQAQAWAWREEARSIGIDVDRERTQATERAAAGEIADADLSMEAVQSGARHVSERETVFSRDALRLESMKAGMGNTDLNRVDAAVEQKSGGLIEVSLSQEGVAAPSDSRHFTTHHALVVEQTILQRTRDGWNQVEPLVDHKSAAAFIHQKEQAIAAATGKPFRYSHGQRAAIELTLTSPDRFTGGLGYAGSGKTKAMSATVEAYRSAGYQVIGLAPSTKARRELEAAGADQTTTMQSYLARKPEEPGSGERRMYVLDEAGMVSARDMDALTKRIEREGARLIEIGDYRQLASVEAGSPFEQQCVSGALHHAAIKEIIRQADPALREVVQQFADGRAKEGAAASRDLMCEVQVTDADWENSGLTKEVIKEAREKGKTPKAVQREAIVRETSERYLSLSPEERDQTLVASGLNATRVKVNTAIRDALKGTGEIAKEGVEITALRDTRITREQRTRSEMFSPGEIVRLTEGQGRDRATTDYTVVREEEGRLILRDPDGLEKTWKPTRSNLPDFSVFKAEKFEVSVGDQVVFRVPDRQAGIANGDDGKVIKANGDGITISLKDGREIELDPKKNHAIDYSWCRTVNDLQGGTCYRIIGAGEGSKAAANLFYVMISRATGEVEVITGDRDKLVKNIEKYSERSTSLDGLRRSLKAELAHLQQTRPDLVELRAQAARELGKTGELADAREKAAAEHSAAEKDQSPEKDSVMRDPAPDRDHDQGSAPAAPVKDQEKENAAADTASKAMEASAPDRNKFAGANKNPDRTSDTEKHRGKEKASEPKAGQTREETGRGEVKSPVEMPAASQKTRTPEQAKSQDMETKTGPATKNHAPEKMATTAKEKSPTKDPVETKEAPEQTAPRAADASKMHGKERHGKETSSEKGPAKSIEPPAASKGQPKEKTQATTATDKGQGVEAPGQNQDKEKAQDKEKDQSKEAAPAKPPTKDRGLDHDLGLER